MNYNALARKINAAARAINDPELCAALKAAYYIALAKGYVTGEVTAEVIEPKDQ